MVLTCCKQLHRKDITKEGNRTIQKKSQPSKCYSCLDELNNLLRMAGDGEQAIQHLNSLSVNGLLIIQRQLRAIIPNAITAADLLDDVCTKLYPVHA